MRQRGSPVTDERLAEAHVRIADAATEIRRTALAMIYYAGSGHPGGSLSAADLLAYLYMRELDLPVGGRAWDDRDRFILSKGHCCPALYAAGALVGLLPREQILGLRKLGSALQGHPHVGALPWVETSTGSLGQGFSVGVGMAMGLAYHAKPQRVYVMLGDGEMQEGQVWEAAMSASHHHLDNLCAIVDYNKMQSDDRNENIIGLEPLRAKWDAFGWATFEIDGHDLGAIGSALMAARATGGQPAVIIAHTTKGKGVSMMEASPLWHGSVKLTEEQLVTALTELGVRVTDVAAYVDGSIWSA